MFTYVCVLLEMSCLMSAMKDSSVYLCVCVTRDVMSDECRERLECSPVCVLLEMSCLMSAMKDSSVHLRDDCAKQLQQRIQLWNAAVKVTSALSHVF